MADIKSLIRAAIVLSRQDSNQLPSFAKIAKLGEESGELCEAVLQRHGFVASDKAGVGTIIEEAADVIFQAIDILQGEEVDIPVEVLVEALENMMFIKLTKWVTKKMALPENLGPSVLGRLAGDNLEDSLDQFWKSIEDGTIFDDVSDQTWELAERIAKQYPDLFNDEAADAKTEPIVPPVCIGGKWYDAKTEPIIYPVCIGGKWYDTIVDNTGKQSFVGFGPVAAMFDHQKRLHESFANGNPFHIQYEDLFGSYDIATMRLNGQCSILEILEGSILAGMEYKPIAEQAIKDNIEVINSYPDRLTVVKPVYDQARSISQGVPTNPQPGDHFAVRVGDKWYDTEIDPVGTQRFVKQPIVNAFVDHGAKMFEKYWMTKRIENHPAVYGLNELASDWAHGRWSKQDHIEFYTMFGYSVSSFSGLSFLANVEIENPLWK